MRKAILTTALVAIAMPALTVTPAMARDRDAPRYEKTDNGIRYWKGKDGKYYCKKPNGTTGLLIGGVAGALVGRTIDTKGDRTVGTLAGAVGGALIGREIERSTAKCK